MTTAATKSSQIHQLIYRSHIEFEASTLPFAEQVQSILEWSREYNPTVGITGALMVSDGYCAQVLEGPLDALRLLYGNIACDPRHSRVLLIQRRLIQHRTFANWSMAYISDQMQSEMPLSERPHGSSLDDPSVSGPGILALLRYLVNGDQGEGTDRR